MTDREYFKAMVEDELPRFTKVFEALPKDKLSYKHPEDPKGKTALELIKTMASEARTFQTILEKGDLDWATVSTDGLEALEDVKGAFFEGLSKAAEVAGSMDDGTWNSPAKMHMGGEMGWETARGAMALSLMLDLIHHRGQLSTYIRPMGGKVPSIYGPSADSAE